MSFIEMSFDGVKEAVPAPEGEYPLVINSAELTKSKAGNPQIVVGIGFEGTDEFMGFRHYLSLPGPDDEEDKAKFKKIFLKRFLQVFDIPTDGAGFNVEDFFGARGFCAVGQTEPNDAGDIFNDLRLPKFKED